MMTVTVSSGATRTKALGCSVPPVAATLPNLLSEKRMPTYRPAPITAPPMRKLRRPILDWDASFMSHLVRDDRMLRYRPHAAGVLWSGGRSDRFLSHPARGRETALAGLRHGPGWYGRTGT